MSFRTANTRLILALLLFVSVCFAPPYIAAIFAVALAARWQAWEVVAAGILIDFLWLPTSVSFLSLDTVPIATIISLFLVAVFEPLRRHLLLGPAL